jgi:RNA polymerase sigma factor (TIGR02999 family)
VSKSVTLLLEAHREGDAAALNQLVKVLYPDLKRLARRRATESAGVGATTLVQETFVKLLSGGRLGARDRREFFALAATVMRQIIVDEIRYVTAGKRDRKDATFIDTIITDNSHKKAEFLLEVDEVLSIVATEDPRLAKVFECRYFGGFTTSETAEALGTSMRSVERLWSEAKIRVGALMDGGPG